MYMFSSVEQVSPWLVVPTEHRDGENGPAVLAGEPAQVANIAVHSALVRQTVYIVEDGAPTGHDIRAVVRSLLPATRAKIKLYRSVDAFLDEVDDHVPGVVIVNGRLSETGGIALLCSLRTSEHPFAVILLAAQHDVALAVCAMKHGAVDVMTMPCCPDALSTSIDTAFAQVESRHAHRSATRAARALIDQLSRRERSVLCGLIRGWSNKKMAHDLDLSPRTVEIHRANLMQKLGARHLSEVMRIVYAAGLIDRL